MGLARLFAVVFFAATPICADEAPLLKVWQHWVADVGARQSTIAVYRNGRVTATAGYGIAADAQMPVMSLSKAVTGACVMALVNEGRLKLSDRLGKLLGNRPDLWTGRGPAGKITVSALLTHTSGLRPDATQARFSGLMRGDVNDLRDVTKRALARQLRAPDFFYNNENYAILHFVIAAAAGQLPQIACPPRVFAKMSKAAPHPEYGVGLTYAGWGMSAADLVRFGGNLRPAKNWPMVPDGYGEQYGPGVHIRRHDASESLWHFGVLCMPFHEDAMTLFFSDPGRYAVAVNVDVCLDEDDYLRFEEQVYLPFRRHR